MAWLDWVSEYWIKTYERDSWLDCRSRLEAMRQEYGTDFALLLEVLSHSDPVGLIATGCPPDEYAGEARRVMERLPEVRSVERLRDLMHDVFVEMFHERIAGSVTEYSEPAHTFWSLRDS